MDDEGAGSAGSHLEEGGESTPPPPPLTPWIGAPSGSPLARRIPSRWAPRVNPHGRVGRKAPRVLLPNHVPRGAPPHPWIDLESGSMIRDVIWKTRRGCV